MQPSRPAFAYLDHTICYSGVPRHENDPQRMWMPGLRHGNLNLVACIRVYRLAHTFRPGRFTEDLSNTNTCSCVRQVNEALCAQQADSNGSHEDYTLHFMFICNQIIENRSAPCPCNGCEMGQIINEACAGRMPLCKMAPPRDLNTFHLNCPSQHQRSV